MRAFKLLLPLSVLALLMATTAADRLADYDSYAEYAANYKTDFYKELLADVKAAQGGDTITAS